MDRILETRNVYYPHDEQLTFAYIAVLFVRDNVMHIGKFYSQGKLDTTQLDDIRPLPLESYCPIARTGVTIADYPDKCYVKTPNLMSLISGEALSRLITRELETCEVLRQRPHRNLAEFYGCKIVEGRIAGLCFKRYLKSLLDAVNPDGLNKTAFVLSEGRPSTLLKVGDHLDQIEAAARHLHSQNIVHNDITPANIMIDSDSSWVLADFDSSLPIGKDMVETKRTYGWHDSKIQVSDVLNDLDALEELRIWLNGDSPERFKFGKY